MSVTPERLDNALDRLAEVMIFMGDKGHIYLPIYERLEQELEQMRSADNKMSAVHARLKRSQDRKAGSLLA